MGARHTRATGPQLWSLNELGLLPEVIEGERYVSKSAAHERLRRAAEEGLFVPRRPLATRKTDESAAIPSSDSSELRSTSEL
jgi:hypothetical protein